MNCVHCYNASIIFIQVSYEHIFRLFAAIAFAILCLSTYSFAICRKCQLFFFLKMKSKEKAPVISHKKILIVLFVAK